MNELKIGSLLRLVDGCEGPFPLINEELISVFLAQTNNDISRFIITNVFVKEQDEV